MATATRDIRKFCMGCMGDENSFKRVAYCSDVECPLWVHRLGRRPETVKRLRPHLLDKEYIKKFNHLSENVLPHPDTMIGMSGNDS